MSSVPGFVLEHLELGDVRDVLDTCGIAQTPNKMGKIIANYQEPRDLPDGLE